MKIIGVTGGIASGKSTVTAYLRKQNIPVFDADASAHEAVLPGSACLLQLKAAFGEQILTEAGELNRKAMAALAFNDREILNKLESIVHSYVWRQAEKFIIKHKKAPIVVLDVPLLIESAWHKKVDYVWLVAIPEEKQIQRALARGAITEEEVRARIKMQMPLAEKRKHATIVLDNTGSVEQLEQQVEAALRTI